MKEQDPKLTNLIRKAVKETYETDRPMSEGEHPDYHTVLDHLNSHFAIEHALTHMGMHTSAEPWRIEGVHESTIKNLEEASKLHHDKAKSVFDAGKGSGEHWDEFKNHEHDMHLETLSDSLHDGAYSGAR